MDCSATEPHSRLDSAWSYQPDSALYDELLAPNSQIRPHWQTLVDSLAGIGTEGLAERWREGQRLIRNHGMTYNIYGGDPQSPDRPWPLDPIPFILHPGDWAKIEAAVTQRATLLNSILADLYGPQRLLRESLLPRELIFQHPAFLRSCCGVSVPGGAHLHTYSADLARSTDGNWWVISDRTQAPSGAGYALENRLVSLRVLPDAFRAAQVHRLAGFFQTYRENLQRLAPSRRENPRIVLLTPGPYNETYFEHAFLARYLGFSLVEGGDLTVRDNCVFLKTLGGLLPVDLIVRRQDDVFCDPLEFRGDSMLGVPGLMQAVRSGNVAVSNALGSGLAESAAYAAFLPGLCRHILGEELKMPSIATWWCGQEQPLSYAASHLDKLVVKPAFPDANLEPVFGARLSGAAREALLGKMRATPDRYVAQEQVSLSTAPIWDGARLSPRHLVLRVYAVVKGDSYAVMPGGLTRVTSSLDSLVVSMQHGGGSKDTWVIAETPAPAFSLLSPPNVSLQVSRATFDLPSRVADNLFWLGRYVGRVEPVVRAARAVLPRILLDSDATNAAGLDAAIDILSTLGKDRPDPHPSTHRAAFLELEVLSTIYNSGGRSTLVKNVQQVRRLAWLLRDRISADAWTILNHFDHQFSAPAPPEPLRISGAQDLLDNAVMSLSAFSGVVMEGMTRGHGWRFLDIGRRLEGAFQMVELLRCGLGFAPDPASGRLETLLDVADSSLTYRSRYLTSMQADLVLDLLLLDEGNPRSAAFQLARLREHVDRLPESQSLSRPPMEARLALSLVTAVQLAEVRELVRPDAAGRWSNLESLLIRLSTELRLLSETLTRVYFSHSLPSRQLST